MSFLDEIDSVEEKLQGKSVSPVMLIGIVSVVLMLAFFALQAGCSALTSDNFQVDQETSLEAGEAADGADCAEDENQGSEGVYAPEIVVYVTGEVENPGVYTLTSGMRIDDAIQAAGGPTEKAQLDSINLAEIVSDGQQIVVPDKSAVAATGSESASGSGSSGTSGGGASQSSSSGKVNINTASSDQLQTLKGIGPALAQRIIEYREQNGRFSKTQDIKQVSGIGDKTYESLESDICV